MVKTLSILFLSITICVPSLAQIDADTIEVIEDDTSDFVEEDSFEILTALDTIQSIPGCFPDFDFYFNWDSTRIDPYRFNLQTLNSNLPISILNIDCGYSPPLQGRINSTFGWRRRRVHAGIDIKLNRGDSIFVLFDGVVRVSMYHRGYGNCVIVRHYSGIETLYAHLQQRNVKVGDLINAGQLIGLGGNTGRSTGPHLHLETRFLGRPFNPEELIDFKTGQLKSYALIINKELFKIPRSKTIRRGRRRR